MNTPKSVVGDASNPQVVADAIRTLDQKFSDNLIVATILMAAIVGRTAPAKNHPMHRAAMAGLAAARRAFPHSNLNDVFERLVQAFAETADEGGDGGGGIPAVDEALSMFKAARPH